MKNVVLIFILSILLVPLALSVAAILIIIALPILLLLGIIALIYVICEFFAWLFRTDELRLEE